MAISNKQRHSNNLRSSSRAIYKLAEDAWGRVSASRHLTRAYIPSIYQLVTGNIDDLLARATGFDWDDGNAPKVIARHGVEPGECEQVFFVEPLVVKFDAKHATKELRWFALGRTFGGRRLYLVFTFRGEDGTLIRVIQARDMNRKERREYEQTQARTETDSDLSD